MCVCVSLSLSLSLFNLLPLFCSSYSSSLTFFFMWHKVSSCLLSSMKLIHIRNRSSNDKPPNNGASNIWTLNSLPNQSLETQTCYYLNQLLLIFSLTFTTSFLWLLPRLLDCFIFLLQFTINATHLLNQTKALNHNKKRNKFS